MTDQMPLPSEGEMERISDAHDLKWAINRLYQIEADFTAEDTATSRNDAKAILSVLEELDRRSEGAGEREARAIIEGFLQCAEIADCAPDDKDPETDAFERRARKWLLSPSPSRGRGEVRIRVRPQ